MAERGPTLDIRLVEPTEFGAWTRIVNDVGEIQVCLFLCGVSCVFGLLCH